MSSASKAYGPRYVVVGVLAGGLIDRAEMTRLATRLALIRYLQRHDYARWD